MQIRFSCEIHRIISIFTRTHCGFLIFKTFSDANKRKLLTNNFLPWFVFWQYRADGGSSFKKGLALVLVRRGRNTQVPHTFRWSEGSISGNINITAVYACIKVLTYLFENLVVVIPDVIKKQESLAALWCDKENITYRLYSVTSQDWRLWSSKSVCIWFQNNITTDIPP